MANDLDLRLGLGNSVRSTLQTLQENKRLTERTQIRLATSKKINDVTDGVVDFFRSEALQERVAIFDRRTDEVGQAISALQSHNTALDSLTEFLGHLRGHVSSARAASNDEQRASLTEAFQEVGNQLVNLVQDVDYDGLNLLASENSSLIVRFSDVQESRITITGHDVLGDTVSTGALFSAASAFDVANRVLILSAISLGGAEFQGFTNFGVSNYSQSDRLDDILELAQNRLEILGREFGNRISLLQARQEFLEEYTTRLLVGSEEITLADLNEEAANSTALELKYQIGLTAITNNSRNQQLLLQLLST